MFRWIVSLLFFFHSRLLFYLHKYKSNFVGVLGNMSVFTYIGADYMSRAGSVEGLALSAEMAV